MKEWFKERKAKKVTEAKKAADKVAESKRKKEEQKKLRDDWMLVFQKVTKWKSTNKAYPSLAYEFKVYYNFYENGLGDRKYDVSTDSAEADDLKCKERDPFYIQNVIPWNTGAPMPDIPTYDDTRREMFVDKLKK